LHSTPPPWSPRANDGFSSKRAHWGAIACSSSKSTGPGGSGNGPITATINSAAWSGSIDAIATRTVSTGDTIISIGGANSSESAILGLAFNNIGPGVYGIDAINEPELIRRKAALAGTFPA
jgi:hypothetical protein